jgi:adenylate kinase family enzyme
VDYYRQRGVLSEIDGVGEINQIRGRVIAALGDVVK